ncbi:hypothetical protein UFOVP17_7 [uncultured Caudovirales phage]|uniref:Uncharacterized protein n=1 Tax=uncultured Caudovirales phage TaxID=2100421 RepID=A0A6J5KJS5_9CAUD|nr:hypothetical protein UFOVP17_7 [uncultured Caudovirales phage]
MKYNGQGKKNNIVVRKDPLWANDKWKPTEPLTDKMAIEAVNYFSRLQYQVKWISLAQWESGNF